MYLVMKYTGKYDFLSFERSKCSKPGFSEERFEHAQNPARNMTAQNLAHLFSIVNCSFY